MSWVIEEYPQGQENGLRIEDLQLPRRQALEPMMRLSVVANLE